MSLFLCLWARSNFTIVTNRLFMEHNVCTEIMRASDHRWLHVTLISKLDSASRHELDGMKDYIGEYNHQINMKNRKMRILFFMSTFLGKVVSLEWNFGSSTIEVGIFHPSIHPFGHRSNNLREKLTQTFPSPAMLPCFFWEIPRSSRTEGIYNPSSELWVCPGVFSRWHQKTFKQRHQDGILIRCLNLLCWLFSMWRNSSSTMVSTQMSEVLALFLSPTKII